MEMAMVAPDVAALAAAAETVGLKMHTDWWAEVVAALAAQGWRIYPTEVGRAGPPDLTPAPEYDYETEGLGGT
jgi:hypothetical protein